MMTMIDLDPLYHTAVCAIEPETNDQHSCTATFLRVSLGQTSILYEIAMFLANPGS